MFPSVSPSFARRRTFAKLLFVAWMPLGVSVGCASLLNRDDDSKEDSKKLTKLMAATKPPELIREAAVAQGLQEIRIDGVAVINQLPGSGGPALPSPFRDMLLEEMKRNEVADPNQFLELNETALVQVRGLIPPGARRGDSIDLQILTPPKTEASDLHSGWLLDTRMRHQQVLQQSVRSSDVMAIGMGPVLTRADFDGTDDETLKVRGRVLSGGLIQKDRKLGLILRPEFQLAKFKKDPMAIALSNAINRRFYFFDGSTRRGIAKPLEDDFIELDVHPRYRGHEDRLMAVVRAIGLAPESSDTQARLVKLGEMLANPPSAADAALQLEGLGETAVPTLAEGIASPNPELRFYAAEALAFLDRKEAVDPLIELIRSEPAFRAPAFSALRGFNHASVVDGLRSLFNESSLETRYGAFATLREREDGKPFLAGQNLGGAFRLYEIDSNGPPAVVVSLRDKPEIVLFAQQSPVQLDSFLIGPSGLMFKRDQDRIRVNRFVPGKDDAFAEVASDLPSILRGIVQVGGRYGDAVATLRMAKTKGILVDQLAFDPLPKSQRTYYRETDNDE